MLSSSAHEVYVTEVLRYGLLMTGTGFVCWGLPVHSPIGGGLAKTVVGLNER